MAESASGGGSAHNATVVTIDNADELEAAIVAVRREYAAKLPERVIAGLRASIEKQRASLASSEAELKRLVAEQKGR